MNIFLLDGKKMIDKPSTHKYLAEELNLPDYYGNNLDALADCLSEWNHNNLIVVVNGKDCVNNLGEYGQTLLDVLKATDEFGHQILIYQ